jgi:membrane associated rhomboid family serine protease
MLFYLPEDYNKLMAKKEKVGIKFKLTWLLIFINVLVFLLVFSAPQEVRDGAFERYALSQGSATQLWRWVTSMFLHASASHLFFNMLGLYFFGRIVEGQVRPQWFFSIYFASGFLGSLAFLFTSAAPVVGASAGIFGLLGAAMLWKPLERVHLYVFPLPLAIIAAMYIITESFVAYYQPGFGNVAHIAHIGGLITGAVFAFMNKPGQAAKGLFWLGLMAALLVIIAPIIGFVADAGQLILNIVDFLVGLVLYGLAWILSFLWF